MYGYIKGIVTIIESNYIVLDNNGIGYLIYTSNPYSFNINDEYKVYVYQNVKEDEISLYGFKEKDEKDLFMKLIDVKGLGPKIARQIVLDLKGKLIDSETNVKTNEELVEALEALGYKKQDIKKVIPNIKSEKIEDQIKEALKLLLK